MRVISFLSVNAFRLKSSLEELDWSIYLYKLEGLAATGESRFRSLSNIAEKVEQHLRGRATYYAPEENLNYIVAVNPRHVKKSFMIDRCRLELSDMDVDLRRISKAIRRIMYKISREKLFSHRLWEDGRNKFYRLLFRKIEDLEKYRIYRGVFIRYEILDDHNLLLVLDPLIKIVSEDTLSEIISREGIEKAKRILKDRTVLVEFLRRSPKGLDLHLFTSQFRTLHPDKSAGYSRVVPYGDEMISIKDYYRRLDAEYFIKDVDDDEMLFQVEGSPNHYLVSKARLVIHFDELTRDERKKLRDFIYLSADQRIELTREFLMLLSAIKDPVLGKLDFEEDLYLPKSWEIFEAPKLRFGKLKSKYQIGTPNMENPQAYRAFLKEKLRLGPAKRVSIPKNARVAIIYPNDIVERQARNFYRTLRHEALKTFNVPLPRKLYCWRYSDLSDLERIRMNLRSYRRDILGALVVLRQERDELYLEFKCLLGRVPNQMLTLDLLMRPFTSIKRRDLYLNSLRNLVSGFLGKIGFRPWLLADELRADFYVGLDTMPGKAVIGVVMNSIGDYLLEKRRMIRARMIPQNTMNHLMRNMIIQALRSSPEAAGRDLLVVVHRDGDLYQEELDGILESKSSLSKAGIKVRYVVVSIRKTTPYRVYNFEEDLGRYNACKVGSYVKLDSHRALLASTGLPLLSQGMARPLLIELHYADDETYDVTLAAREIYALSFMHWATITQKIKLLATVKYADDFAYMIGKGVEEETIGPPL